MVSLSLDLVLLILTGFRQYRPASLTRIQFFCTFLQEDSDFGQVRRVAIGFVALRSVRDESSARASHDIIYIRNT